MVAEYIYSIISRFSSSLIAICHTFSIAFTYHYGRSIILTVLYVRTVLYIVILYLSANY